MSSLFGDSPKLYVVNLEELRPGDGRDERRWRVTLAETGTEEADAGDVEVYVAESQYWLGEHEDVRSWIVWSLESTHPYDRARDRSWIEQLQAVQPITLHRGLNRD